MHSRLITGLVLVGLAATPSSRALQQPELPVAVCVVAPRVEPVEMADALGVVPVSRPRLVLVEPLLGWPHAVGVVLVGAVVIIIVATAGMASTTSVSLPASSSSSSSRPGGRSFLSVSGGSASS